MNEFTVIILAALALELGLGVVSDWLNLRALKAEMPDELSDIYRPRRVPPVAGVHAGQDLPRTRDGGVRRRPAAAVLVRPRLRCAGQDRRERMGPPRRDGAGLHRRAGPGALALDAPIRRVRDVRDRRALRVQQDDGTHLRARQAQSAGPPRRPGGPAAGRGAGILRVRRRGSRGSTAGRPSPCSASSWRS